MQGRKRERAKVMPTTEEVLTKRKSHLGTWSGGVDEIAHLVTALSRAGGTLCNLIHPNGATVWGGGRKLQSLLYSG